jgi:hypothetical protein
MPGEAVVHLCPPAGENGEPGALTTPCCGRWVHEMVLSNARLTNDPDLVTCKEFVRDE